MPDSMITQVAAAPPALLTDKVPIGRAGDPNPRTLTLEQLLALSPRKNRVRNAMMNVAQRGTSYALTTAAAFGSLDGWAFLQAGAANGFANQTTSPVPPGFSNSLRLGRNAGGAQTGVISALQAFESIDSRPLAGGVVTISFWATIGSHFSAAGSLLGVKVITGTGTDQSSAALLTGWTGQATPIDTTQAISVVFTRYSFTAALSAAAKQIGLHFYYTPAGTAGADDSVYITGVQVDLASQASAFEVLPFQQDLAMSQRFLPAFTAGTVTKVFAVGQCTSTTAAVITIPFLVPTRAQCTGISVSAAGHFGCTTAGGGVTTATGAAYDGANAHIGSMGLTGMAGLVAGDATLGFYANAAAKLFFTGAEL